MSENVKLETTVTSEQVDVPPQVAKPKYNYNAARQVFKTKTDTYVRGSEYVIDSLPVLSNVMLEERMRDISKSDVDSSKVIREHFSKIIDAQKYMQVGDHYFDTVSKGNWTNEVTYEGEKLIAGVPRFKAAKGIITGSAAIAKARQAVSMGYQFIIPLWHSGFWMMIEVPSEAELNSLYEELTRSKIELGRRTYGLSFSNTKVYTTDVIWNFIKNKISWTTLKLENIDEIEKYIEVEDFNILVWGLASSIWNNGFSYERACTADAKSCQHVVTDLLDITKMLFVDKSRLTTRQLDHMSKRVKNETNVDSLSIYKDDFLISTRTIDVKNHDSIKFVLSKPSLDQYIKEGKEWVDQIEKDYGNALGMSTENRDQYLFNQGKATRLRTYSHYVSKILIDDDVIESREAIFKILNDWSSIDDITNSLMDGIYKLIDDIAVAVVGVPNYECPKCGCSQTSPTDKNNGTIVPVESVNTFFILLIQMVNLIVNRD